MVMGTKYCITTLSFPADITESRIKKNENSLTAERWLISQIKASRPFVGQYISAIVSCLLLCESAKALCMSHTSN